MLKFSYYLVFETILHDMKPYPRTRTCAKLKSEERYIIIDNLEEFLKDGKSGLSDEIITDGHFILINDSSWKSRINNKTFYR